jgi:error-prone DNA polymerase
MRDARYAELVAATNFSFLRGASPAEEMLLASLVVGQNGLGIADRNSVAGVVRAYGALRDLREGGVLPPLKIREGSGPGEYGYRPSTLEEDTAETLRERLKVQAQDFRLVTGARLAFADGTPDIVAHPRNRAGWGRLCRLLTLGNRRARKGECHLALDDLLADTRDLSLIVLPQSDSGGLPALLGRMAEAAPGSVWLGAAMMRRGDDRRRLARLAAIAKAHRLPLLALNDALYASAAQRDLQDILTCIREGATIASAGRRLEVNAERHVKSPAEMARLFADCPEAVAETQNLLACIDFSLDQLRYEYPDEVVPPGLTPQGWLETLTWRHAAIRYGGAIPDKVERLLRAELALIAKLDYARYFLTIHDIVRVAEDKGILCQGRGSAANSAVCFVLGITSVDPNEHNVLFARFISEERREPPDIDVDFEHERREEIIQHIYQKYGRHRAGIAATVIRYRPRSAIRDVGKALGLTEDVTAAIANTQWGSWGSDITRNQVAQAGLDPDNAEIRRAVGFAKRLLGFPRHLSQHVGGFILARGRLDELTPIGNAAMPDRTFIEWDKDDIDTLGLMKVDVLALGMLTCIRKALDYLREEAGLDWALHDVPREDEATYDMLCRGDSIGVFQVESRAQINMLPRLRPREFYDLVIQVAIVRPGPIQGNMVHPYLRRRQRIEAVSFPSPAPPHDPLELHKVLDKTLGVPLFQEQAMQLAMVAAEFSDVEANQLRRAMATFRNVGTIHLFEALMVERMVARGYDRGFAQNCFEQIKGFGSYGFPESHAASFARLVYISSYLKCHYPAIFACALLNAQPMGFYAPAQIVRDAREHGVELRPVDINHSDWNNTLEREAGGELALRLGLRQIDGMHEAEARRLMETRGLGFTSIDDLAIRARLNARTLRLLADADAFHSVGRDRRQALWEVRRLPDDDPLPLFASAAARELGEEPDAKLPLLGIGEQVATDYQTLRLSLKAHPMAILRPSFAAARVLTCAEAAARPDGHFVRVAGLVLVRQRPGKGNAIFITLEDETGISNLVLWARQFEAFRRVIMGSRLMLAQGLIQKSREGVTHLMARAVEDRSPALGGLWDVRSSGASLTPPLMHADEGPRLFAAADLPPPAAAIIPPPSHLAPDPQGRHPRNVRVLPRSRDFH